MNLVLVGGKGWHDDKIFHALELQNDLRGRIIVTGFAPDADLSPLYSGALAFVYPSLYEGFGLPPLEAMQCGTPVITSDNSALPEVVGDAGIMVNARDEDALCAAMWQLYAHPARCNDLSAKSLQRAEQFSWEKCRALTIEAYRFALQNR